MGLFKKRTAGEEQPAQATTAAARGAYDIDEHLLSPQEVAERYAVQIDFGNVQGSHGLTSAQVWPTVIAQPASLHAVYPPSRGLLLPKAGAAQSSRLVLPLPHLNNQAVCLAACRPRSCRKSMD
jgi:hypothetical protein